MYVTSDDERLLHKYVEHITEDKVLTVNEWYNLVFANFTFHEFYIRFIQVIGDWDNGLDVVGQEDLDHTNTRDIYSVEGAFIDNDMLCQAAVNAIPDVVYDLMGQIEDYYMDE